MFTSKLAMFQNIHTQEKPFSIKYGAELLNRKEMDKDT